MVMLEMVSSNIRFVEYFADKEQLVVAFEEPEELFDNCRVYRYFNVPKSVYEAFINFPSKGEYLCEHIAYKFEYEFLGDGEAYKP
jgi:hypothetical protein